VKNNKTNGSILLHTKETPRLKKKVSINKNGGLLPLFFDFFNEKNYFKEQLPPTGA
jgi:hypothetical protein